MYSPTLSSALIRVDGQRHVSAALPPDKSLLTNFAGGCVSLVNFWMVGKILAPTGVRTVHLLANRTVTWAIPAWNEGTD